MSERSTQSTKWKYTFKLLAGLFLIIPAIRSILRLPNEFRALELVWQSDDPGELDKVLGDLREKGML